MAFCVLSLSQLVHAFNMRSDHSLFRVGLFRNRTLVFSFVVCALLQISVVVVPPLAALFKTQMLTLSQWLMVILLSLVPLLLVEVEKWFAGRREKAGKKV
jgi:Ca2+-transporting ATPase